MFKDDYFKKLMNRGALDASITEIETAIKSAGKFTEYAEWRMGTCAEVTIASEGDKFRVAVNYDYNFSCTCPTLEKAIKMAGLFVQMLIKLDEQVGWPSNA